MKKQKDIERRFLEEVARYERVIRRVCFMYSSASAPFDDLYQETMVNLWRGFESFRGDSQLSTWIYRTTINTCVTWFRKNSRHNKAMTLEDALDRVVDYDDDEHRRDLADMYKLISQLDPFEKAIIMMWLDESSYDEIANVTGLSRGVVSQRLYRIKHKLAEAENQNTTQL